MDGKSMPGANNVADSAKTFKNGTKTAAEAVAMCFNSAIKYICESIKMEAFAKDIEKDIDAFCANTQQIITKLFNNIDKILDKSLSSNTLKTKIKVYKLKKTLLDVLSIPSEVLEIYNQKKLEDIDKFNIAIEKTVGIITTALKKLSELEIPKGLKLKLISATFVFWLASISLVSLSGFLTIGAIVGAEAAIFFPFIITLQKTIDVIDKLYQSLFKIALRAIVIMQLSTEIDMSLIVIETFLRGMYGILTQLFTINNRMIRQGRRKLRRLNRLIKLLVATASSLCLILLIAIPLMVALLVTIVYVGALIFIVELINRIPLKWKTIGILLGILTVFTLLILIAVAAAMLLLVIKPAILGLIVGLIMLGLIALAVWLIAKIEIDKKAFLTLLAMIIVVALLVMIAFALVIIGKLGNQISWEGLGWFGLGLLAIVGVMIGLGALMATGLGAAALGLGIVAIVMIAGAAGMLLLAGLAMVKMSEIADKIDDKAFAKIINAIVSGFKEMFTPENLAFLNPISLFFIMGSIAELTMIVGAIGLMAGILQDIASMKIPTEFDSNGKPTAFKVMDSKDFMDAAQNAGSIIEFFGKMFTGGGKLANGINVPDLTPFLDVDISLGVKIKFRRLKKIVGYIGEMAETLQNIASLNMPNPEAGYDANGNPKGWKKMKKEDFMEAADSAGAIITFFAKLFTDNKIDIPGGSINNPVKKILDDGTSISWFAKRRFARISEIVGYVGDMATVLQKIASMNIPVEWDKDGKAIKYEKMKTSDFKKYAKNVKDILNVLIDAVTSDKVKEMIILGIAGADDAFENLGLLVSPISGMVDIITKLVTLQIPMSEIDGTIKKDKDGNIIYKVFNIDEELPNAIESVRKITDAVIEIGSSAATNIGDKLAGGLFNDIEDSFNNLNLLMNPITSMVDMIVKIAEAKIPKGYDAEGNPTGYRKLRDKDIIKARLYIEKLSNSIIGLFLTGDGKETALLDKLKSIGNYADGIDTGMNAIKSCVLGLSEMADAFENNKKLESENAFKTIGPNIDSLVASIGKFKNTDMNAINAFKRISIYIEKISKSDSTKVKSISEDLSKFIKQINDTNLDKLKHAADLMKNMAEFSKSISGNFDKLADTINEKLMTILQELKEILEKASGEIKDYHENSSTNVSSKNSNNIPQAVSSPAKDEKDKNQKKIDLTETNRKIGEVTSAINRLYDEISDGSYFRR